MTGAFAGRDSHEVDALVTDRYLDAILAAHARGADHGPAGAPPAAQVRLAADRLARDLPRLHPSFRFEEALAARLAEAAARMGLPVAAGGEGLVVPIARNPGTHGNASGAFDTDLADADAAMQAIDRLPDDRRRALILRFVDEMSTAEIAGVLGRSEGAVRVLIHRALRSVARDLDDGAR